MVDEIFYLYHIRRKGLFSLKSGYIGITNNPENRWKSHQNAANRKSIYIVHKAMNKYNDIEFKVLCAGNREYISDLEYKLRSKPNTGWNITSGGYKRSKEDRINHAEIITNLSESDVKDILISYFEHGENTLQISNKYKICSGTVSDIVHGRRKYYPELEKFRKILVKSRKYVNSQKCSLTEEMYNNIMCLRESGMTYKNISDISGLDKSAVTCVCTNVYRYLKEFSCYREVINPSIQRYNYKGSELTIAEISNLTCVDCQVIRRGLKKGLSVDETIAKHINKKEKTIITYNNQTHNIKAWSRILNIDYKVLWMRLNTGWEIERAFTEPINKRR